MKCKSNGYLKNDLYLKVYSSKRKIRLKTSNCKVTKTEHKKKKENYLIKVRSKVSKLLWNNTINRDRRKF